MKLEHYSYSAKDFCDFGWAINLTALIKIWLWRELFSFPQSFVHKATKEKSKKGREERENGGSIEARERDEAKKSKER